jgi:streptomycin 6-kinase
MAHSVAIPQGVARAIADVYGSSARTWLDELPTRIEAVANRWSLRLSEPFARLSCSYVIEATLADGRAAVLKASYPGKALVDEIAALQAFDGRGCARLIHADPEAGFILLERAIPGTTIEDLDDRMASSAFCSVVRKLHRPPPTGHRFPTTHDWAAELTRAIDHCDSGGSPFPLALVSIALSLFEKLHHSASPSVLLHGDLHHENILAHSRQAWLAIDPKGVIGEPAYEAGAFLRNPMPAILGLPNTSGILRWRVEYISAELNLPRDRLLGWATAQAVLAAWWYYEDHKSGWEPWLRCAELLLKLYRQEVA